MMASARCGPGNGLRSNSSSRLPPSTCSIAIQLCSPSSPNSSTATMPGWRRRPMTRASLRKRCRIASVSASLSALLRCSVLMATMRPSSGSTPL